MTATLHGRARFARTRATPNAHLHGLARFRPAGATSSASDTVVRRGFANRHDFERDPEPRQPALHFLVAPRFRHPRSRWLWSRRLPRRPATRATAATRRRTDSHVARLSARRAAAAAHEQDRRRAALPLRTRYGAGSSACRLRPEGSSMLSDASRMTRCRPRHPARATVGSAGSKSSRSRSSECARHAKARATCAPRPGVSRRR